MCSEAAIPHMLAEVQRQAEEWALFLVEKKEGFRSALIGDCGEGGAGGRLTGSEGGALCDWFSLLGPQLEVGTKIRDAKS